MAKTVVRSRDRNKRLKPKVKTEKPSWQKRNAARKDKQDAHGKVVAEMIGDGVLVVYP